MEKLELFFNFLTPEQIQEFCMKNSVYCRENRNFICKTILKSSGYKTPSKYNNVYCTIYKELSILVKHIKTKNKISKIENELYLYFDIKVYNKCKLSCSVLLIDFLKDNGININKNNLSESINKTKLSKSINYSSLKKSSSMSSIKYTIKDTIKDTIKKLRII